MAELQQPDIVGNYLASYYGAQDRVQKQQANQYQMQRQQKADQWAEEDRQHAMAMQNKEEVARQALAADNPMKWEALRAQVKQTSGVDLPGFEQRDAIINAVQSLPDLIKQRLEARKMTLDERVANSQIAHNNAATQALREKPPAGVDPNTGARLAPPGLQGRDSSTLAKFSEQADAAGSIAATLQGIKPQLDKGMTGPGLSNRRAVAGALSYLPDFGLDGGTTTDYMNTADAIDQASKTIGIDTLQKMGGSDTERELLTAIQTTVNKDLLPRENWRRYNNSIAAADILSKKAQLASEWVNRFGSLSYAAPDGTTWQGFWPQYQKQAWAQHRQRMAQAEKEFDSKGGSSQAAKSGPGEWKIEVAK